MEGNIGRTRDLEVMLGDPKKAIKAMILPLLISFLIIQLNSFSDQAWVSALGANSLNAVASISPYYWIMAGIGAGIGVGATASIARHLADDGRADPIPMQALFVSVLLSAALMVLVFITLDPAIDFMGVQSIRHECREYIIPMTLLCIPIVFNGVIPGIMRGEGAARRSMYVNVVTVIANFILDPLFIYTLDMGVAGAGWATGVSSLFGITYGWFAYRSGTMQLRIRIAGFRPDVSIMTDILVVGIPKTAESLIISVLNIVQRYFLVGVGGVIAVSLYNIPWRFVAVSGVLSMAIGAAMVPIISAALAVKDDEKADVAFRYSFRLSTMWLTVIAAVVFVLADYLVAPFVTDPTLECYRREFADVLRLYSVMIPFVGMIDIGSSMLQAMRKAQMSMVMSLVRNFIIIGLFAVACNISLDAMFQSLFIAEFVGGLSMVWMARWEFSRYRRRMSVTSCRRT